MTAGILTVQYKFCKVFMGDKNGYNSLQLIVYMGNLSATSKWNGHNIVHKNYSCCDFSIFLWLFTICMQWWISYSFMKKIYTIPNAIRLLAKPNNNFFKKWIWLVEVLFVLKFQVIFYFSVQKSNII